MHATNVDLLVQKFAVSRRNTKYGWQAYQNMALTRTTDLFNVGYEGKRVKFRTLLMSKMYKFCEMCDLIN